MATLSEGLSAYRICARAEGRSPRTIDWICQGVGYFRNFLGPDNQEISIITADDLRRFIVSCRETPKFSHHPVNKPQNTNIPLQPVQTYARAIRAFFGYLHREGLIETNPMVKVKMPKVPAKVVPILSEKEIK